MSYMFELYHQPPVVLKKETALCMRVKALGGRLTYREEPNGSALGGICLSFEFDDRRLAESAAENLREQGEHVEGPVEY